MTPRETHRPSPEELLRLLECHEYDARRGRLKIFLGYAPRVGKSERMFDEGLRRKSRGQDVVVGAVQSRGAEAIAEKIAGLEVVGNGALDIDRILERQPQVCLIDELAVEKRWIDVGKLLANGINVITALNIQYIEELQDDVERITGRRASDSVPIAFIRGAGEIVLVDAPTPQAAQAQLREMALCLAAEVIEAQLQRYMDLHGIHQSWGTQERILVCVTPRSNARAMIESGRRNADRFHGQLFVAYVEQLGLGSEDREALDANLEQARQVGAEIHLLEGRDAVAEIVRFAREHRITQIFAGHSGRARWLAFGRNPVDRLIEAAEGIDVRIFPQSLPA